MMQYMYQSIILTQYYYKIRQNNLFNILLSIQYVQYKCILYDFFQQLTRRKYSEAIPISPNINRLGIPRIKKRKNKNV